VPTGGSVTNDRAVALAVGRVLRRGACGKDHQLVAGAGQLGQPGFHLARRLAAHAELRGPAGRRPAALATRMAELAGVDAGRVRLWLFARSVQESIGSPLMCQVAGQLAPA